MENRGPSVHIMQADDLVDHLMEKILDDIPYKSGDEVAVMINGLGLHLLWNSL